MDVTDMIDYNLDLLSRHYLGASFFHLDRNDPTVGFDLDAKMVCGHTFPLASASIKPTSASVPSWSTDDDNPNLYLRLVLGSHLAQHVRHQLEEQKGYTSTVGVSTNKLVAKLVGNLNKPKGQTTLVPPYFCHASEIQRAVTQFIDAHEIGKIPGIGFKLASKIRAHVLGRPPEFDTGLIYGGTKEALLVAEVRSTIDMGPDLLETLLGGPGAPKGIGDRIWGLMNGLDNTEVSKAKNVPQQISVVRGTLSIIS